MQNQLIILKKLKRQIIIFSTIILLLIIIGVYFLRKVGSAQLKTAEIQKLSVTDQQIKEINPTRIEWREVAIEKALKHESLEAKVIKTMQNNFSSLPITGQWEDYTVRVVPNDRFTDQYKYAGGVKAIQGMSDGRVFFGTYDYFGIKEATDSGWTNLTYYDLQLPFSTSITFFSETLGSPYEVYFGDDYTRGGKIIRMKTDGTFELVVDPTDLYGYLRNVKVVPYKDNHGAAAYRSTLTLGELYYLEQGNLRKWLSPKHSCGSSTLADQIITMATDPNDNHKTFAVIGEYSYDQYCQPSLQYYLYQYIFSSNPDIPLEILKWGKIEGNASGGTGGSNNKQAFLSRRLDNPEQKILYYGPPEQSGENELFIIPYLYDDGQNMEVFSYNINIDPPGSYPWIYDFAMQQKPNNKTDHLWFIATEYFGVYLGREFDGLAQGYLTRTTDTSILASPYLNTISTDRLTDVIYTGHSYTPGQFNDGMITILEKIMPSPSPSPLPTYKVFITSNIHQGNMFGISGADGRCQNRATLAGLSGTYKAWLSTSTVDAKDRIPDGRYVLVDGTTVVAENKVDLTDGTLVNKLSKDEYGVIRYPPAWTGTLRNGLKDTNHCSNWTSTAGSGRQGASGIKDFHWTENLNSACSIYLNLYCFQTGW